MTPVKIIPRVCLDSASNVGTEPGCRDLSVIGDCVEERMTAPRFDECDVGAYVSMTYGVGGRLSTSVKP